MKRKLCLLLLIIALMLTVACGKKATDKPTTPPVATPAETTTKPVETTAEKTTDSHYPVTISNFGANKEPIEITFKEAPKKVLAVYQDSIETLLALGLGDRIVASYGLDQDVKPEYAAEFAKANYTKDPFSPAKETVISLQPDLILSWSSIFSEKRLGAPEEWIEKGTNTYMMMNSGAVKVKTLENEYTDILNIGKIFNVEEKAEAIVNEMKEEVDRAIKAAEKLENKPRVLVMEFEKGDIRVYGEGTLGGDMVEKLGANLVKAPENHMNSEALINENPDVIFTVYFGSSTAIQKAEDAMRPLKEDPKYASLDAVKNGKVFPISLGEVYCSGTRTLDGIKTFIKGIYPELAQ